MIIKNYETNKIDLKKFKYFLLYGNNKGHIDEIIKNNFVNKLKCNLYNYDESEIINDRNNFFDQILNNSFFENEKIIIISRISEKSKKIIEEIQEKKVDDIIFIFKSGTLEKKSKLRKFFEEDKNSICIAFYPDTSVTLNKIANEFFKVRPRINAKGAISISPISIILWIFSKWNKSYKESYKGLR